MQAALRFLNRWLTLVSIAVALVGVALMLVGPLRTLFSAEGEVGSAAGGALAALRGGSGASPAVGGADDLILVSNQLDRGLVPYTIIPDRPRNQVITYTVQPGDTLTGIATMFSLDRTTIFWANADTLQGDVHMLRPGMDLYILPVDGVYHKSDGNRSFQWIADKYSVPVEDIINSEYNELAGLGPDDIPNWGMRLIVPGGVGEFTDWRSPIQETVDAATGAVTRSFMPGMPGSCAAGITGSGGSGAWARPVQGAFSFSQPYYPGHTGVDLAAPVGTPVTAADSGVVVYSGWVPASWGYGILVVLDHGNGWTTYYAHLSVNGAGCGAFVPRGGYLGQIGSTGNSSGPHLHFEMRWGHVPDNPASYIGF
jgi:murein DD-endopeptidase MepM/ murein hydrolase activator NlpD